MVDLSTLDPQSPRDTDSVSLGDDAIRATREAVQTTMALEHDVSTGYHKIPTGAPSARPPAGHKNRLYINTTSNTLEYDTGVEWKPTSGAQPFKLDWWPLQVPNSLLAVYTLGITPPSTLLLVGELVFYSTAIHNDHIFQWVSNVGTVTLKGENYNTVPVSICQHGVTSLTISLGLSHAASSGEGAYVFFNSYIQVI